MITKGYRTHSLIDILATMYSVTDSSHWPLAAWRLNLFYSYMAMAGRILVLIVYLCILTYKMFSLTIDCIDYTIYGSTIDYRWCVKHFPQDLNRLSAFNPLDCFAIHFKTILIQFLCVSGFRSPVYPTMARILHWQTAWLKHLNEGMLILSDLELPIVPYVP